MKIDIKIMLTDVCGTHTVSKERKKVCNLAHIGPHSPTIPTKKCVLKRHVLKILNSPQFSYLVFVHQHILKIIWTHEQWLDSGFKYFNCVISNKWLACGSSWSTKQVCVCVFCYVPFHIQVFVYPKRLHLPQWEGLCNKAAGEMAEGM